MRTIWTIVLAALLLVSYRQADAFDGIRVTLLGTGMAEPPQEKGGPGAVVEANEEVLLFDCGHGTLERLQRAGLPAHALTAVFLTSLDGEHVVGCPEVWAAALRGSDFQGLVVWGPSGTAALFRKIDQELGIATEVATRAFDIGDNVVYQPESLTVTAFVTDAAPQARHFGYRVDANRRAILLSNEASYPENIVRYARGVQLMMQEVSGRPEQVEAAGPRSARPSPEEAGRLFRASRPYLAVYSYVMSEDASAEELMRRTFRSYRGPVQIGRDLMVIEVQNEVQIRSAPSQPRMR